MQNSLQIPELSATSFPYFHWALPSSQHTLGVESSHSVLGYPGSWSILAPQGQWAALIHW